MLEEAANPDHGFVITRYPTSELPSLYVNKLCTTGEFSAKFVLFRSNTDWEEILID